MGPSADVSGRRPRPVRAPKSSGTWITRRDGPRWWPFFALCFAVSWTGYIGAALTGREWTEMPTVLLYALGGCGPLAATLALTSVNFDAAGRRAFWRRVVDPRAVRPRWYLIILVLGAGPAIVAVELRSLWERDGSAAPSLPTGAALVGILAFNLLASSVEEPGWRGYALDRLRARLAGRVAALVVGAFWILWHLPLYFVEGTFQAQNGVLSPAFVAYSLALLPSSVLFGWAVVRTGGSVFAAVLFHLTENVSGEILELDVQAQAVRVALLVLIAAVVWWRWTPETPRHESPACGLHP